MSLTFENDLNSSNNVAYLISKKGRILKPIAFDVNPGEDKLSLNRDEQEEGWFMPYVSERPSIFMAGGSGSGKSYVMRLYAMMYKKQFPNNAVYIISSKDCDETLDSNYQPGIGVLPGKLSYSQIVIDEDNYENMTWENLCEDLTNSLVLFDDCIYSNKKVFTAVQRLQERILNLGRDKKIGIMISKHVLQDAQNRVYKNASRQVILFPQHSSSKHIKDFLKQVGLTQDQITDVLKSTSRWIVVNTTFPKVIVSQNKISVQ